MSRVTIPDVPATGATPSPPRPVIAIPAPIQLIAWEKEQAGYTPEQAMFLACQRHFLARLRQEHVASGVQADLARRHATDLAAARATTTTAEQRARLAEARADDLQTRLRGTMRLLWAIDRRRRRGGLHTDHLTWFLAAFAAGWALGGLAVVATRAAGLGG